MKCIYMNIYILYIYIIYIYIYIYIIYSYIHTYIHVDNSQIQYIHVVERKNRHESCGGWDVCFLKWEFRESMEKKTLISILHTRVGHLVNENEQNV